LRRERAPLELLCRVKLVPLAALRWIALAVGILALLSLEGYCTTTTTSTTIPCSETTTNAATITTSSIPTVLSSVRVTTEDKCPNFDTLDLLLRGLVTINIIEASAALLLHLYFIFKVIRPAKRLFSTASSRPGWFMFPEGRVRPQLLRQDTARGIGWKISLQLCCTCTSLLTCCLFGGFGAVFGDFVDISMALEQLFDDGGYLDVTISDIIHGLVLVAQQQYERRESARRSLLTKNVYKLKRLQSNLTSSSGNSSIRDAVRLRRQRTTSSNDDTINDDIVPQTEKEIHAIDEVAQHGGTGDVEEMAGSSSSLAAAGHRQMFCQLRLSCRDVFGVLDDADLEEDGDGGSSASEDGESNSSASSSVRHRHRHHHAGDSTNYAFEAQERPILDPTNIEEDRQAILEGGTCVPVASQPVAPFSRRFPMVGGPESVVFISCPS